MKSRENLVRLKRFQVNEKRRQILQLDMMIAEFDRMATELELQIAAEEKKSGIADVNHFAYPTFAKAARVRRDNLKNSQADLAISEKLPILYSPKLKRSFPRQKCWKRRDHKTRDIEGDRSAMIG